jgi:hypothetical protein
MGGNRQTKVERRHRSPTYASKVVGTAFGTARLAELALSADDALLFRSVRPFIQSGAFDPESIAVMSEAFEAACKELDEAGQPKVAREVIAGRIIAAAKLGERDPVRLRAAALTGPRGERD